MNGDRSEATPSVSIVFLVCNRRDELRDSLQRMLVDSDYPPDRVDVIVVDNASTDGAAAMVREEFPGVQLIVHDRNVGVSGFNSGFAAATGDYVLALDDDCYLPPDGLTKAVSAAEERAADLVSFDVISTHDRSHSFTKQTRPGLLTFWGCAVLIRRRVLEDLTGYDPEIFVWANELEFMVRFFDHGYRHLHFPEVVAEHMKRPQAEDDPFPERAYRFDARHFAYIAGRLLHRRDAVEALVALIAHELRNAIRAESIAHKVIPDLFRGFAHGLRHRQPVRNPEISRVYRHDLHNYASPWWWSRPAGELLRSLPRELTGRSKNGPPPVGRREQYFADRAHLYPDRTAELQF